MNVVLSNNDLIHGFRNGDEIAIRQLYNQHYRPLCYFSEKLINNKTEAEDIAVDTFLKLLNKRDDFETLADIKSFLFTATRNACFDFLRKIKRQDKSSFELEYLSAPQEVFGEKEMITAQVLQVIFSEVESFPCQSKKFLNLFL